MTLLSKEEIVTSLSIFSLQFSIYKPDTKKKIRTIFDRNLYFKNVHYSHKR